MERPASWSNEMHPACHGSRRTTPSSIVPTRSSGARWAAPCAQESPAMPCLARSMRDAPRPPGAAPDPAVKQARSVPLWCSSHVTLRGFRSHLRCPTRHSRRPRITASSAARWPPTGAMPTPWLAASPPPGSGATHWPRSCHATPRPHDQSPATRTPRVLTWEYAGSELRDRQCPTVHPLT